MTRNKSRVKGENNLSAFLLGVCVFMVLLAAIVPGTRNLLSGGMESILSGGRSGAGWITDGLRSLIPLSAMERQRMEALQEQVYQLQTELAVAEEAVEENRQLRELLDLEPMAGWERLPALVIARDPISWNRRFRINRGRADGVELGNLILVGDQAAGRVVEAGANTALVATLTDPECRLSVRLRDNQTTGALIGGGEAGLARGKIAARIDFLPRDASYKEGEIVETSGLSDLVPGGMKVGEVVPWEDQQVAEIVDSAFARLRVAPSAELTDFRVVAVLLRE